MNSAQDRKYVKLLGVIGLLSSAAAEFWLYSDLTYPRTAIDFKRRRVAFTVFFLSSLVAGLALLALVLRLAKSGVLDRFFAAVLILFLPLFIALFFVGPSIFTAPALVSMAIAGLSWRFESKSSTAELGF